MKNDQGATEEITLGGLPIAALAAAAGVLGQRDQPVAFQRGQVSQQVGIGRAGTLDNANSTQKSDPAARSLSTCSGPIRR